MGMEASFRKKQPQNPRRAKRMSVASQRLDRGNKGYLDKLETAVRNFDQNGDGVYDINEVFTIVENLESERKAKYCLRKGLCTTGIFALILFAAVGGLMIAVIELSKEISPGDGGNLVNHNTGALLSTHSRGVRLSLNMAINQGSGNGGKGGGRNLVRTSHDYNHRNLRNEICESSPNLFADIPKAAFEAQWGNIVDGSQTYFEFYDGNNVERIIIIDGNNVQRTTLNGYTRYTGLKDQGSTLITVYYTIYCYDNENNCQVYKSNAPTIIVNTVNDSSATFGITTDFPSDDVKIIIGLDTYFVGQTWESNIGTTSVNTDCTGYVTVNGLNANTQVYYKLLIDGVEIKPDYIQTFKTYPSTINNNDQSSFSFLVFADAADGQHYNPITSYASAGYENALFALQIGDFDHSNPKTLNQYRKMHRNTRNINYEQGQQLMSNILSKMSFYHTWNDHDYCNYNSGNSGSVTDCPTSRANAAKQAFTEYYPNYPYPNQQDGIYYNFVVGNVEIFMLDTKSQRDNSGSGTTMLGQQQYEWLKQKLHTSTAQWRIIVSSVTSNKDATPISGNGHWSNYQLEANYLRVFLGTMNISNKGNIIVLSGDLHTSGAMDNGCNSWFGLPELNVPTTNIRSTGPGAQNIGTWNNGVDIGTPGYALIEVDSNELTLITKRSDGTELKRMIIDPTTFTTSCST